MHESATAADMRFEKRHLKVLRTSLWGVLHVWRELATTCSNVEDVRRVSSCSDVSTWRHSIHSCLETTLIIEAIQEITAASAQGTLQHRRCLYPLTTWRTWTFPKQPLLCTSPSLLAMPTTKT